MRDPDITGAIAKAWRCTGNSQTQLAGWLVNGPFHPMWSWWAIGVIHLRDVPGVAPANRQYPEAEYELLIMSIDPDCSPDPDKPESVSLLLPPDVAEQFHGVTDRDAVRILEACVRAITNGHMSPDSDYRHRWHMSLKATVEHYRSGAHAEN